MLDKVLRVARLFDFYGALLTERQRQCLELHYLQDLSLAEIAGEFSVSRQAIHDILRRSEQILEECEVKLKLVERYQSERQTLNEIYSLLMQLPEECGALPQIGRAVEQLRELLTEEKEIEHGF